MSNLQPYQDPTGQMTQEEVDQQNIINIINELNNATDAVNSLNNTLTIVAYGTLTYIWPGTGSGLTPTVEILRVPAQSEAGFIALTYFSRNTDNPTIYFAMPYQQAYINANSDTVIGKSFLCGSNPTTGQYELDLVFYNSGTPITYTFYYLLLQQPANITAT